MDYYQGYNANSSGNNQSSQGSAGIVGRDDDKKLFVGGLSRQTSEKDLVDYFSKYGPVEGATIKLDQFTGQSRGFAFVVFGNTKTIDEVLAYGDHYINDKKVDPKRVTKKTQQGKIFVGGLTPEISDSDIRNYFSQYGNVVEVQAPFDKVKNQRKGFCFITFDSKDVVFNLLKNPKQCINGKEVDVKKVKLNMEGMGPGSGMGAGRGAGRGGSWSGYGGYGGYGTGYGQSDFGSGYGSVGQSPSYGGYGGGYDYSSYYPTTPVGGSTTGYGAKPRGGGRQFQRHQPY
ncbi:RNA-binding protein squid-like [Bacillus rossius redtenbacheri]|uniref:RNA-binding protein squid-like n=1 Tax=Bacillus rossius redtenbacheri TaxID=93214 RepID=UPI002FDEFB11